MVNMRTYSELARYSSFVERFEYLKLLGSVGVDTFGRNRYLNQMFYRSPRWKHVRDQIILRDNGCDLGIEGYDISSRALIHHINPITEDDILEDRECLYDPDNLITVSFDTHNAIHYGDPKLLRLTLIESRHPHDTRLW